MDIDSTQQAPSIGQAYLQQIQNGGDPTQAPQVSQGDSSAPAPAIQPTPQNGQSAGAPAQTAPPPDATSEHHRSIGKFFSNMLTGGSGSSASQMWRSVISGALVGMGAAEDGPVIHGPYGDVRDHSMAGAASRGFQAGIKMRQDQQDRQMKIAKEQQEQQRKDQQMKIEMDDATLRKAADARAQQASIQNSVEHEKRMVMLDQSIRTGNWDQAQRTAQVAQQQVNFFNALQDVGAQPLVGSDGQALQYSTHEEAERAAHDNPKFFIGDFKTRTAYDPSSGKYGIYRVPDTDIKNVQLKDQQGVMHTVPRMTASEYLDYQTRVQGLQKGKLEVAKIGAEITRLQNDVKASGLYGSALKDLTAATDKDGNVDLTKLPAGSRAVLVEHSAKGLEDALRARAAAIEKHTKAVEADDKAAIDDANQSIDDASQIVRHYSGVLTTVTGNKKASTPAQGGVGTGMVQVQLANGQPGNIQADKLDAFLRDHPGSKKLGGVPVSSNNTPINVQLPDGSTIQSSPENVGKYLNSNKGSKIADADAKRFQQWSSDKQKQDDEDREAGQVNLQD